MFGKFFRRKQSEQVPEVVAVDLTQIGGPPELEFLFIDVAANDVQRALDGWAWIGLNNLAVIAVSAFGDVFFRAEDGSIQFLDMIEGRLSKVGDNLADFTATLQETDRRDELLLAGMVIGARNKGINLTAGECYDFEIAPIVGGPMSLDKVHKISFVVKVHIAGQLHEQVKDLPPGTRISGFKIAD
ncbi:DUF1851 domain-containing protein [Sphingopyxis sp. OPL5]|jgi:hypothetical protein|uniref:T6SS immunity protein Tdi1 domain-containing protein n=1 Tax=Sphingopyxis sp. OPL5 TaxID=2486273 RepID=UPI00164E7795|nr:T6SS immunity protein Tdi1 domain-containing protein [Sphingopyxis sp. OPL5]QNO26152.1 DUF1851 domain-containing protein [Sphingopyxis sp. OPL5]